MARGEGPENRAPQARAVRARAESIRQILEDAKRRAHAREQKEKHDLGLDRLTNSLPYMQLQHDWLAKELDKRLLAQIKDSDYAHARELAQAYYRQLGAPEMQAMHFSDLDLELAHELYLDSASEWSYLSTLRAWTIAKNHCGRNDGKLEQEYLDPEMHPNRYVQGIETIRSLLALAYLQRGNLDGNDAPAPPDSQCLRVRVRAYSNLITLGDLSEKDRAQVADNRLVITRKNPQQVDWVFLYLRKKHVYDLQLGPHREPTRVELPEGGNMTYHQLVRLLPLETVAQIADPQEQEF